MILIVFFYIRNCASRIYFPRPDCLQHFYLKGLSHLREDVWKNRFDDQLIDSFITTMHPPLTRDFTFDPLFDLSRIACLSAPSTFTKSSSA